MRGPLVFLLLAGGALAQSSALAQSNGKVDRIEIVEVGIYRAETTKIEAAPGTATRQRNILTDTRLVTPTTRIEAKIGVHFGIRYRVVGRPGGSSIKLTSVTHYPAPGLKNPKNGGVQTRGEHPLFATISQLNYRGYLFEHDWELVAGRWTFELWDGDRRLASQTFDVVKP